MKKARVDATVDALELQGLDLRLCLTASRIGRQYPQARTNARMHFSECVEDLKQGNGVRNRLAIEAECIQKQQQLTSTHVMRCIQMASLRVALFRCWSNFMRLHAAKSHGWPDKCLLGQPGSEKRSTSPLTSVAERCETPRSALSRRSKSSLSLFLNLSIRW